MPILAPSHRGRQQRKRQRKQRVAEADEFEQMADAAEHMKLIVSVEQSGDFARIDRCQIGACRSPLIWSPRPQRRINDCSTPSWSQIRPTTKSTRSPIDFGAVVKAGAGGQHDRAGFGRPLHVVQLRQRERRLPRHEDQLAAFFQMHFGGAVNQVRSHRVADRRQACRRSKGRRPSRRSGTIRWRSGP